MKKAKYWIIGGIISLTLNLLSFMFGMFAGDTYNFTHGFKNFGEHIFKILYRIFFYIPEMLGLSIIGSSIILYLVYSFSTGAVLGWIYWKVKHSNKTIVK